MTVLVESIEDALASIKYAIERLEEARDWVTAEDRSRIFGLAIRLMEFASASNGKE